ncbi:MAG TPA: hypothetical protein VIK22_00470 [Candidatus Anoxymicrobiaceae bacterium]
MRAISTVAVLIAVFALILAGCANEVNLSYSAAPENVVVELSSSGGLPTPWVDNVSSFKLYGDGRVVKESDDSKHRMLVEGKLDQAAMKDLLVKIREAGFFELVNAYSNKGVLDGVTDRVAVNLAGQKKTVTNYMEDVHPFTRTQDVIRAYPVKGLHDFVPEKGYLVVQKNTEPPAKPQTPPGEIAALVPSGDRLEQAASGHKPIELDGQGFLTLKKWESAQQYAGADVLVGGTWYKVFPLYTPGTF